MSPLGTFTVPCTPISRLFQGEKQKHTYCFKERERMMTKTERQLLGGALLICFFRDTCQAKMHKVETQHNLVTCIPPAFVRISSSSSPGWDGYCLSLRSVSTLHSLVHSRPLSAHRQLIIWQSHCRSQTLVSLVDMRSFSRASSLLITLLHV